MLQLKEANDPKSKTLKLCASNSLSYTDYTSNTTKEVT